MTTATSPGQQRRTAGRPATGRSTTVVPVRLPNTLYQELVRRVPASPFVVEYAVSLSQKCRPKNPAAPQFVKDYVEWGPGPRASQYLILGGKARTILQGRYAVSIEDIQALAPAVLRHRVIPNFKAQAEGLSSLDLISRLMNEVKPEEDGKRPR